MASSGSSQDIDEILCRCQICLQQYREPKQLPCLHRYCSDCLKQLIEKNQGVTVAYCPECRDEFTIPKEGVDGFKTDFYMNNIIECIQLQKSLEGEQLRACYSCSKTSKVASYCFKCNGFLCKECYEFHMISKSLEDHKQHVVSLQDLKSKHMTLEKLVDLKEAPRCQSHLKESCLLCCKTCNDLPICVACVHGRHKNHDINDVEIIANEEREKLKNEMEKIIQNKERMLKMPQTVDRVKEKLISNVREKKEKFTPRYERDMQTVRKEIKKIEEEYNLTKTEIESREKAQLMESRKQMDHEMNQLKVKYDKIFDEIKEQSRVALYFLKQKQEENLQLEECREKMVILEMEFKTFINSLETRQEKGLKKLEEISQQIDGVIERYENLTTTGYSVLETRNNWTAVQCIPDICKAIEPLSRDMKKDFPELDPLSRIGVSPEIIEDEKSPVNVGWIQLSNIRGTACITGCDDGSIVITGLASPPSHITVIDMIGKILLDKELNSTFISPMRLCAFLSEFKVATVCHPNEIGVFDIRDYSYIKKNISDVINSWPESRRVSCVTTDPVNNHILVGGEYSRDVYVFDDQLNYLYTLTLPKMINYPHDMTISENNLLVCDIFKRIAYKVSMNRWKSEIIRKFTKPDFDGDELKPINVCTDMDGFIYILWMAGINFTAGRRIITQYTQHGRELLTAKHIDANDATCIATIRTGMTEKLLMATWKSAKLHVYSIW